MEGKLFEDATKLSFALYLKQREDVLRYYETLIIASAALGNFEALKKLLDEYYKALFPYAEKIEEERIREAREILEKFKDVTFLLEGRA